MEIEGEQVRDNPCVAPEADWLDKSRHSLRSLSEGFANEFIGGKYEEGTKGQERGIKRRFDCG